MRNIAEQEGICGEGVRLNLIRLGLGDRFKTYKSLISRRNKKSSDDEFNLNERLVETLTKYILTKSTLTEKKALEFRLSINKKMTKVNFNSAVSFFEEFYYGNHKSYTSLANSVEGINLCDVSRILKRVNIEEKTNRSNRRKKSDLHLIKNGLEYTSLTISDLAYFLTGETQSNLHICNKNLNYFRKKIKLLDKSISYSSYKNVSGIYEALDCGFNNSEIRELLTGKSTSGLVEKVLSKRSLLEPLVISELNSLFNGYKINGSEIVIDKPYLSTEQRLWYKTNFSLS